MQHPDHLPDHLQIFRRDIQPQIESLDELTSDLFARVGGDIGIRFQQGLALAILSGKGGVNLRLTVSWLGVHEGDSLFAKSE
jgi:hypothetical protein